MLIIYGSVLMQGLIIYNSHILHTHTDIQSKSNTCHDARSCCRCCMSMLGRERGMFELEEWVEWHPGNALINQFSNLSRIQYTINWKCFKCLPTPFCQICLSFAWPQRHLDDKQRAGGGHGRPLLGWRSPRQCFRREALCLPQLFRYRVMFIELN